MNFTNEQLPTFQNNKHQIVIANAGSGKTTILVEKYLNLILLNPPERIEKIVAITFTRKAAAEMRQRVVSRLNNEISKLHEQISNNTSTNDYQTLNPIIEFQRLITFREHITNARIQTIHSFCFSILKDHAVEIELSPDFVAITESEKAEVIDNFIFETIEEILENANNPLNPLLIKLLNNVAKNTISQILDKIATDENTLHILKDLYSLTFPEYRAQIDINAKELIGYYLDQFKAIFLKEYNNLISIDEKTNGTKQFGAKFEQFYNDFKILPNKDIYDFINKNLKDFTTFKIGRTQLINTSDELKSIYEKLKSVADSKFDDKYLLQLYEYSNTIKEISLIIRDKYDNYKKETGLIDYDDILWKTYYLLSNNPDILNNIKANIDYLLVDEFQDTDSVQYEIIRLIVPFYQSLENKLFVVGDPKQSIYGFRQADVRIMNQLLSEIPEANQNLLEEFKDSDEIVLYPNSNYQIKHDNQSYFGVHNIKISHRLNLVNTAFVNQAFTNILKKDSFKYSVDYDQFIIGREIPQISPEIDLTLPNIEGENNNLNELYGKIKFLTSISPQDNNSSEDSQEDQPGEAELLAKYIAYLISSNTQIYDNSLKELRKIELRDIAILMRSRNRVSLLAKALDKYGLPYILNTAENFFLTQEILDIVSFLKFLDNPNDDLSFASIAKSAFFGLDDNFLIELRQMNTEKSLWENFQEHAAKIENSNQLKINRILKILNEYINKYSEFNPLELIQDFLFKTHYSEIFQNHPSKFTILNNIEKFIQYVRNYNSRYIFSISDLIAEIDKALELRPQESEISISDDNAINILTIHGAKGLEFPIVAIYNMNASSGMSNSYSINDKFGLTFKYYPDSKLIEKSDDTVFDEIETPDNVLSKFYQNQIDTFEEQRLLYVALTRAKEFIILSSTIALNKNGEPGKFKGLFKILIDGLSINPSDLITEDSLSLSSIVNISNTNGIHQINLKYNVELVREDKSKYLQFPAADMEQQQNIEYTEPNLFLDEIQITEPHDIISPTKLETYIDSPLEFIDRYILNIETLDNFAFADDSSSKQENEEISASIKGLIFHNTFEKLKEWINQDQSINEDALINILKNSFFNNGITIREDLFNEIKDECKYVISTDLIQSILKYINTFEFEKKFYLPFKSNFLNAIIDVLYQDDDGNYYILDWKTNLIQNKQEMNSLVEHYSLQMKFYAYIVSFINPNQDVFTARLLFTRLAKDNQHSENWSHLFSWDRNELIDFENMLDNYIPKMNNVQTLKNYIINNL